MYECLAQKKCFTQITHVHVSIWDFLPFDIILAVATDWNMLHEKISFLQNIILYSRVSSLPISTTSSALSNIFQSVKFITSYFNTPEKYHNVGPRWQSAFINRGEVIVIGVLDCHRCNVLNEKVKLPVEAYKERLTDSSVIRRRLLEYPKRDMYYVARECIRYLAILNGIVSSLEVLMCWYCRTYSNFAYRTHIYHLPNNF